MYADDFIDQLKAYIRLNRQVAGMGIIHPASRLRPHACPRTTHRRMDENHGRMDRHAPTNRRHPRCLGSNSSRNLQLNIKTRNDNSGPEQS